MSSKSCLHSTNSSLRPPTIISTFMHCLQLVFILFQCITHDPYCSVEKHILSALFLAALGDHSSSIFRSLLFFNALYAVKNILLKCHIPSFLLQSLVSYLSINIPGLISYPVKGFSNECEILNASLWSQHLMCMY